MNPAFGIWIPQYKTDRVAVAAVHTKELRRDNRKRGRESMRCAIAKGILACMLVALVGCRGAAPIYNVASSPVTSNKPATAESVQKAIARAGASLGWQMASREPGKMEGILVLRDHRAVVDIAYDAAQYSIQYRDSSNLNYDSGGQTIHNNYNGWIQNLDRAIRAQLSAM
jgi:hypothetical protein